jgi:lipoprotein NlpD
MFFVGENPYQSLSVRMTFAWRLGLVLCLCGGLLVACSANRQAPVESRSGSYNGQPPIRGSHYRVRPGDTLYGIAWRANLDYHDIARWNQISQPYVIYVGQALRLKASLATPQLPNPDPTTTTSPVVATAPTSPPKHNVPAPAADPAEQPVNAQRRTLQWFWPTKGTVTQRFSAGDDTKKGIKISGTNGQAVIAAEAGQVVYSGNGLVGYGELVIIKHNKDYLSAYGHNARRLVREGQRVQRGTPIAEMGMAAGSPKLHFEIRRKGKPVDPIGLLPKTKG